LKTCARIVQATASASDARSVLEILASETSRAFSNWDAELLYNIDHVFQLVWPTSLEAAFKVFESAVDILFVVRTRPRDVKYKPAPPYEATLRSGPPGTPSSIPPDSELVTAAQDVFAKYVPAGVIAMLEITLARPGLFPEAVTGAVVEFLSDFARLYPAKCAAVMMEWDTDSAIIASEFAGRVAGTDVHCDSQYRNPLHALHAVCSTALKNVSLLDRVGRMLKILCKENAAMHRSVATLPALARLIAQKT
jgi:hypothetical protein